MHKVSQMILPFWICIKYVECKYLENKRGWIKDSKKVGNEHDKKYVLTVSNYMLVGLHKKWDF